jgi:dienelactone hydrolase
MCLVSVFIILVACFSYFLFRTPSYLIKPTGKYGIGSEQVFLVNPRICPDSLYQKNANEEDFSPGNDKKCHEIVISLFYPTHASIALGDSYPYAGMQNHIHYFSRMFKLPPAALDSLNTLHEIKTFVKAGEAISTESKFPLILFMSGQGMSIESYQNIISELTSHGYIILGINSVFANGFIQLANKHVVPVPIKYNDSSRMQNFEDLKLISEQLRNLRVSESIKKQIDFEKVGLLGHSMGAMSLINFSKKNMPNEIKAMAIMDPGNILDAANYPIELRKIPSLLIWSSRFKHRLKGSSSLGADAFELILSPKAQNLDFSNHGNFSDLSTLQYHPAFSYSKIRNLIRDPLNMNVGLGNGFDISETINHSVVYFFNRYIKGDKSEHDHLCDAAGKNVLCSGEEH